MKAAFSLNILNKIGSFVKTLNRSHVLGVPLTSTLTSTSLQNAACFTSLAPPSSVIASEAYKTFVKDTKTLLCAAKQPQTNQLRALTKFSLQKGARKSVKAVPPRFFRLRWGIWIRTMAGRHKKLWKKTNKRKNTLLQHVFCNHTQSKMLDKMVNRFWRVPKHYIEDPYEVYHTRENFCYTKKKPWRPDGVDYE